MSTGHRVNTYTCWKARSLHLFFSASISISRLFPAAASGGSWVLKESEEHCQEPQSHLSTLLPADHCRDSIIFCMFTRQRDLLPALPDWCKPALCSRDYPCPWFQDGFCSALPWPRTKSGLVCICLVPTRASCIIPGFSSKKKKKLKLKNLAKI